MLYKLYGNEKGWELLAVKGEVEEIISILDYLILEQHKEQSYLIIEHNIKLDMDNPYALINGDEEKYLEFKEENKQKKYIK